MVYQSLACLLFFLDCSIIVSHGLSRLTILYHYLSWCIRIILVSLVFHSFSLFIMFVGLSELLHGAKWLTTVGQSLWLCILGFHGLYHECLVSFCSVCFSWCFSLLSVFFLLDCDCHELSWFNGCCTHSLSWFIMFFVCSSSCLMLVSPTVSHV